MTDEIVAEDAIVWDESYEEPEVAADPDEDYELMQAFLQQMQEEQEAPPMPSVERYWLSEYGYINISLVSQGDQVALLVNDGENTMGLFDSAVTPIDYLYTLQGVIASAIAVTEGDVEDGEE